MFVTIAWIGLGALIGAAALRLGLALGRGQRGAPGDAAFPTGRTDRVLLAALGLAFAVLFASGFHASLVAARPLAGVVLILHCVAGLVFAVALAFAALWWADACRFAAARRVESGGRSVPRGRFDAADKVLFWLVCVSGLVSGLSVLASMVPLFGPSGLEHLYELHRYSSLLVSGVILIYTFRKAAGRFGARQRGAPGAAGPPQGSDP